MNAAMACADTGETEMNVPAVAPQEAAGLIPASMREAMDLAQMMAKSTVVPTAFRGKPADCLLVIMQAVRWQMDPFAVIQECSMIRDKLFYSGKLVAAVINTRGRFSRKLTYSYTSSGDNRTITVSGHLQGEQEPRTVQVRFGDAKTENKAWQTQPEQQLMYHGVRVWGRRHLPQLMLGVFSPEEDWKEIENDDEHEEIIPEPKTYQRSSRRLSEAEPEDRITDELIAQAKQENETDTVKQCAMRCKDARFHKFLEETNSAWKIMKEGSPTDRAAELVRAIVGVKSRKDIVPGSEAAEHWFDLEGKFQAWLRA